MKAISGKDLSRLLEKREWKLARVKGSHHVYIKKGHPARISVPIHGNKTLKRGLQRHLMKLAGIKADEL